MNTNNFRIDSVELQNLLRTFNINRSDIKELWSTGTFGTIAVPADRYKQYYDAIETQAQRIATLEAALRSIKAVNETVDAPFERGATIENIINKVLPE